MAFTCTITMPNLGLGQELVLDEWLVEKKTMISKGDLLFSISCGGRLHVFSSNMPCLLAEKLIDAGACVKSGQPIAVAWAEGEDIPYGKPYVIEEVSSS